MADLNVRANEVFNIICEGFESRNWRYTKDEENLIAAVEFSGDDLPMKYIMYVEPSKETIFIHSDFGVVFPNDKLVDAAVAVTVASHNLVEGAIDLQLDTGRVSFRSSATYRGDCAITKDYPLELLDYAYYVVEKYNDLFFALKNGYIDIQGFIEKALEKK